MDKTAILHLLQQVRDGATDPSDAMKTLCSQPFEDLGYAKVDHHRTLRQGVPEVIYGEGKTSEQIVGILAALRRNTDKIIIITRLSQEKADTIKKEMPIRYDALSRLAFLGEIPPPDGVGSVVVAAAGTSDLTVAEEAAKTAEALGNQVLRLYDVGVAGLHRLLSKMDVLSNAKVIISVAGMEGALTSVIAGLVSCPVIGVPTSVGYGASFQGVAALLSMLNSCASGVSVVNIDNGFGAGYLASMMNHLR